MTTRDDSQTTRPNIAMLDRSEAGPVNGNGGEDEGIPDLVAEALTSQAAFDQLIAHGNLASVPASVAQQITDWKGLTSKEEQELRRHKAQEDFEEYERTMEAARRRANELIAELDEQERECRKKLAEAEARAIILRDGRRILVDANGDFIEEASGRRLEGADKEEAERKRNDDSETVAEHRTLTDRLKEIREAKEHATKANEAAAEDGSSLSSEQRQRNQAVANDELAKAAAISEETDGREKHLEVDSSATSTLSNTDTLAALGLGDSQNDRTTSFAASLDGKDNRAMALQNGFNNSAQVAPASLSDNPVASAATEKERGPRQNQSRPV